MKTILPWKTSCWIAMLSLSVFFVSCKKDKEQPDVVISSFTVHAAGGATVTIDGSGFSSTPNENTVKINNVVAAVQSATNSKLEVTVPAKSGSGTITVTVGTKMATSGTQFTYDWVGVITGLAGSDTPGFKDDIGANAQFQIPYGLAVDAGGNVYVADWSNHRIRKVTPNGNVTTLAGSDNGDEDATSGAGAKFTAPSAITLDGNGNAYVTDIGTGKIRKVSCANGATSTVATGLHSPIGIAANGDNLHVVSQQDHQILNIGATSGIVSVFAGSGTAGAADGLLATAQFRSPDGIAMDINGNVYVADLNRKIRKISAGAVSTLAGSSVAGSADGPGNLAQFTLPYGLVTDANGNVYVADSGKIRRITPAGMVSTIAYIDKVTGMAIDNNGILYASNTSKIFKIVIQ